MLEKNKQEPKPWYTSTHTRNHEAPSRDLHEKTLRFHARKRKTHTHTHTHKEARILVYLCASLPAPPAWVISSSSKRSSKPILRRPPPSSFRALPLPLPPLLGPAAAAAPPPGLALGFLRRPPCRPRGFLSSSSGVKIVRDFTVLLESFVFTVCFEGGRGQALCTAVSRGANTNGLERGADGARVALLAQHACGPACLWIRSPPGKQKGKREPNSPRFVYTTSSHACCVEKRRAGCCARPRQM